VWHIRDELARDSEVLYLRWGVSYQSGVYAVKALCLTREVCRLFALVRTPTRTGLGESRRSVGTSQQRA